MRSLLSNNGYRWSGVVALIWLTSIISLYYVNHKPFEPTFATRLLLMAGQFCVSLWIIMLCGGLGAVLLPELSLHPVTNMVLQAAIGLGVLSLAVLLVGSILGISSLIAWLFTFVVSIMVRKRILQWVRPIPSLVNLWVTSSRTGKLIALEVCLILITTLLVALAPPIRFDALVYHLTFPELYLNASRIIYLPQNAYWGMPQTGEMLYTLALAMAGIETASVLSWAIAALALLGILSYVADRLTVQAGWVAIASLLASGTLAGTIPAGYIDWLTLLFGFSALVGLDQWRLEGERRWLIIAGLFSGLAMGTKYTAGIILLAGLGLIFWQVRPNLIRFIKESFSYLTPGILISMPWWVKNLLATGNPFYPFFTPSGEMDAFRLAHYNLPPWGEIIESALLPIRATLNGIEGTPGYSASIGSLLLGLGPLVYLGWKNRSSNEKQTLKTSLILSLFGLFIWSIASRFSGYLIQSRLYFSLFPALGVLAAGGYLSLGDIRWFGIRFGRVANALIVMVFSFSVLQVGIEIIRQEALPMVIGVRTREEYLDRNLGWYAPTMRAVSSLPEDSNVLMLWEPRGLYCLQKCSPDEILDRWLHERYLSSKTEDILMKWREAGYTHLLLNRFGADFIRQTDDRYTASDWQELEAMLAQLPEPENFGDAYYLYSIEP